MFRNPAPITLKCAEPRCETCIEPNEPMGDWFVAELAGNDRNMADGWIVGCPEHANRVHRTALQVARWKNTPVIDVTRRTGIKPNVFS